MENYTAQVDTDTPKDNIEDLFEKGRDYVETRIELMKLQAIDKTSDVLSSVLSKLILVTLLLFFMFTLNVALGLLIGKLIGEYYLGFFILAAVYLIAGIIVYNSRDKWLKTPITTMIIQKIFKPMQDGNK